MCATLCLLWLPLDLCESILRAACLFRLQETVADLPVSLQVVVMVNSLWAHIKDSR